MISVVVPRIVTSNMGMRKIPSLLLPRRAPNATIMVIISYKIVISTSISIFKTIAQTNLSSLKCSTMRICSTTSKIITMNNLLTCFRSLIIMMEMRKEKLKLRIQIIKMIRTISILTNNRNKKLMRRKMSGN